MKKFIWILLVILLVLLVWKGKDYFPNLQTSLFGSSINRIDSSSGLVAYWKMNSEGGEIKDYSQNSNDGTINNATPAPGKIGSALSFDGNGDYVSFSSISSTARTQSGWFRWTQLAGDKGTFNSLFSNIYQHSANNFIYFGGTSDFFNWTPSVDTWYHLAVTFTDNTDTNTAKLYVNGVQYNSNQQAGAHDIDDVSWISSTATNSFSGLIDEVRIYDTALSAAEITDLYKEGSRQIMMNAQADSSKGLVGWWPLDSESQTMGDDIVTTWNFTTWTSWVGGSGTTAASFTTDADGGGVIASGIMTVGKTYRIHIVGSMTGGSLAIGNWDSTSAISALSSTTPFDRTAYITVTDSNSQAIGFYNSGNTETVTITTFEIKEIQTEDIGTGGNNAVFYQDAISYRTDNKGQANKAQDLDGSYDYIDTGADMIGTGADSVSAWIYADGWGNNSVGRIVDNGKFSFGIRNSGGQEDLLFGSDSDWGSISTVNGSIALDTWYHAVATRDTNGLASLYINGVLSGDADRDSGTPTVGANNVTIGGKSHIGWFDGAISDLRIYNRELSASEVTELYNTYNPGIRASSHLKDMVGHWPLNLEHSNGVTVQDRVIGGNNGTATSGPVIGATSTKFDNVDDYIDLGSDTIGTGADSISVWIYLDSYGEEATYGFGRIIDNTKFQLFVDDSSDRLNFKGDGSTAAAPATNSILLNTWYHVVLTRNSDGTNTNFYIDGVLSGSADQPSGDPEAGGNVLIGNNSIQTRTFDGKIADVRHWNRVLTASEASELYDQGRPKSAIPKAADFNGTDQFLAATDADDLSFGDGSTDNAFMLEAWINMDDATNFRFLSKGVYNTDFEYQFYVDASDKLTLSMGDESVSNCYIGRLYNTAITSYEGQWAHVIATYDGSGVSSGIKFYLDGTELTTIDDSVNSGSYVAMENLTHDVWLGRYNVDYVNGQIDAVRIYNFGSSVPSNIDNLISYNYGEIGRIHESLKSYLVDGWDLNGDGFAMKSSTYDLTNSNGVTFVKP